MQAADAISQVLALCGTTADSVDSIKIADELGDRVQCQACRLVMDVASVVRSLPCIDAPRAPPLTPIPPLFRAAIASATSTLASCCCPKG